MALQYFLQDALGKKRLKVAGKISGYYSDDYEIPRLAVPQWCTPVHEH